MTQTTQCVFSTAAPTQPLDRPNGPTSTTSRPAARRVERAATSARRFIQATVERNRLRLELITPLSQWCGLKIETIQNHIKFLILTEVRVTLFTQMIRYRLLMTSKRCHLFSSNGLRSVQERVLMRKTITTSPGTLQQPQASLMLLLMKAQRLINSKFLIL